MSCRKYEAPRHGSLAYCPKKRTHTIRMSSAAAPPSCPSDPCHLTSFLAYKAGMTHIVRVTTHTSNDKKARETRREVVDAVCVLEAPGMKVYGIRIFTRGVYGLTMRDEVLAGCKDVGLMARLVRRYSRSKHKTGEQSSEACTGSEEAVDRLMKYAGLDNVVVKVMAFTLIDKLRLGSRRAHCLEIVVNGGSTEERIRYAAGLLGKEVRIGDVFSEQELISITGVTKGKGFTGVVKRFGVRILPRKTNKGARKVACIGAWHPAGVLRTVARAGQYGHFRRTLVNKKVLKIGEGTQPISTEYDLTKKTINPMGGFLHYGNVRTDYVMVKGACMGPPRRVLTLTKSFSTSTKKKNTEHVDIKFIDTSSKQGHGRFQTVDEKRMYYSK